MKLNFDVAFVGALAIQEVDGDVASIAGEFADVVEVGFDKTNHHQLFGLFIADIVCGLFS